MRTHIILIGFVLFILTACTSDDGQSSTNTNENEVRQLMLSDTFIISSFIDSGNDKTGHFRCYAFQFNSNGTVTASDNTNTYNGTWSITGSNSDDDSEDDLDFNIYFNLTNEFEELNDDWDIVSYSTNRIELLDVSGGNGGTDKLVFQIGTPSGNCDSNSQSTIENNVQMGTWRITRFIDSGTDETYHFNGYNFTFNSSGVVNANNGTNSYNGSWSITDSNSNDDSTDDLDFNINFNLTNEFEELNDDWDFISQSATKIELIDVSGGNGGTDYLTFEKN